METEIVEMLNEIQRIQLLHSSLLGVIVGGVITLAIYIIFFQGR